ncbi:recombinase family protein [Candidatus Amarobacter glycogenicus]|uniref:recombinase family protein n=1 Tax=Candidatus Amarobacter glycogenicus TaxID=3140699 RepID=UPI0031354CEC|nr:recombinase family protein [Dehalococcoidia bacterium]
MSLTKAKSHIVSIIIAIYVRVSTTEQTLGHSLVTQEDACRKFAETLGLGDIVVYSDAGFSAKTSNRPAFQRLLDDADAGRIGAVIVWKGDRFARNRLDALLAKERCERPA